MQIVANKKDFIWNYIGLFFRMGKSIILLPLLLGLLSADRLGLWYVFLAISNFIATFQAGFSPSFARNIAYCWSGSTGITRRGVSSEHGDSVDFELFSGLMDACRVVYRAISVVVLLILSTAGTAYVLNVSSGLDVREVLPAWIIFCLAILLNIYFSYYESLLRGVGQFSGVNRAIIFSNLIQIVSALVLLLAGWGILACALSFLLQGLSYRLFCHKYFWALGNVKEGLAQAGKQPRKRVHALVREVAPNAVKDTVVSVANFLTTNATTLLCSMFLSLAETGVLSVALQLFNMVANVSAVLLTTYQPTLQSAFANGNRELERDVTAKVYVGYIAAYVIMAVMTIFVVFPVLTVIKSSFWLDWPLMGVMAVYYFLWRLYSTSATLITNTNNIPYMWSFIISAFLGIALSAFFMGVLGWGALGLVLGQLIVQLCYNDWKWPYEASKRLNTTFFSLISRGISLWMAKIKHKKK